MEKRKDFKDNITNAINTFLNPGGRYGTITGDTNTINTVKSQLKLLAEQRNEFAALKWIRIDPVVLNGKEYFQILKLRISGRNNSWYQFKRIVAFIFFPDGYPQSRPIIFFENLVNKQQKEQTFEHVNIFATGKLCLQAIQDNYVPSMTIGEIVLALEKCIYDDNVKSPANGTFSTLKKTKISEYNAKLHAQSEMLEWLDEQEIPVEQEEDY